MSETMTDENHNDVTPPQHAPENPDKALGRVFPHSMLAILILVILIATALLPGILSEDTELPVPATGTAPPTAPQQTQAFSPQGLEDLRSDPTEELTINPEPLLLDPLPEDSEEVADEDVPAIAEAEALVPEEESPAPPEEPFSVGEALARYLLAIREELNSEYVANCIRFRNRNEAGAACPADPAIADSGSYQGEKALVDELFAVITRETDYARISRRLETENETLAAILNDPDNPAALQASTKLALNNAYLNYLSGNPSPAVTAFNTMNDFINDYNRTIMAGPTQFSCQDGPCVYEFTGPEAE